MAVFPIDQHGLIHRSQVLAAGLTDDDLARGCRREHIVRLSRGVFVTHQERSAPDEHRLRTLGVALTGSPEQVVSHESAAVLHGLAMLRPEFTRVHLTIRQRDGGYRTASRHVHAAALPFDQIVDVDGIRVTSRERTAVDVACTSPMGFAGALAIFDAALRAGADRRRLRMMLAGTRRGIAQARHALRHADPRADGPEESWGRAQLIEAGLPVPRLKREFGEADVIFRADYDWDGRLIGRFDRDGPAGAVMKPESRPAEQERQAEHALQQEFGIRVIHWTRDDLATDRMVPMVRAHLSELGLLDGRPPGSQ